MGDQPIGVAHTQQESSGRTPPTEEQWDEITIRVLAGVSSLRFLSSLLINDGNESDVEAIGALVEVAVDRIEELLELKGDTYVDRLNRKGVVG